MTVPRRRAPVARFPLVQIRRNRIHHHPECKMTRIMPIRRPKQIAISHAKLAFGRHRKGAEYCRLAPFYWGANAPIFRRLFREVGMFRSICTAVVTALCVTLLGFLAPASAQDRRVPSSPAELRLAYAPIVQRVQPAVVNVYAAKVVQNRNPLLDDPIFRRFFGVPGQQQEQVQRSLGSGVIVDASGLVVTNVHVIEGADQVKVSLSDKREFEAEIVLKDPRSDLAVLRLKDTKEKFPALDFTNSDELMVGDVVLAIGNPFGVGQTVTHGIISALALRWFAGHRLRDPGKYGARRRRLRQGWRQGGEAALARCKVAGGDARDRRKSRPALADRRAGRKRRAERPRGEGRFEILRPHHRYRRPGRG